MISREVDVAPRLFDRDDRCFVRHQLDLIVDGIGVGKSVFIRDLEVVLRLCFERKESRELLIADCQWEQLAVSEDDPAALEVLARRSGEGDPRPGQARDLPNKLVLDARREL